MPVEVMFMGAHFAFASIRKNEPDMVTAAEASAAHKTKQTNQRTQVRSIPGSANCGIGARVAAESNGERAPIIITLGSSEVERETFVPNSNCVRTPLPFLTPTISLISPAVANGSNFFALGPARKVGAV